MLDARRLRLTIGSLLAMAGLSATVTATTAEADPPPTGRGDCPPAAMAVDYSDGLDKLSVGEAQIGGLSALDHDPRAQGWVSVVDNHGSEPSRLWYLTDPQDPQPVGEPLVLKAPDGTPYTGETADNEGLTVLPGGDYVVSSESEPSIRIFGTDGVQTATLGVPERFAVDGGESSANETFEGLTSSTDGRRLTVAMEGTLSGDTGDGTYRRMLVYSKRQRDFRLSRQVGYRVEDGMRIAEITEYAPGRLLVLETRFEPMLGNTVELYATDLRGARDVSEIADLADAPESIMDKTLVADVTNCPDLGATAKQPQINPLMDNYEALHTRHLGGGQHLISLLSDDNFGAGQTTRMLNLLAELP